MQRAPLDNLLQQFFNWRVQLSRELYALQNWMRIEKISNAAVSEKIPRLLSKLEEEKITIAVVAEFSRGKTELINALFFADHGKRLLPSGAGTTTMCPTEILFDAEIKPGLRLLPIETREHSTSLHEYKKHWDEWIAVDFNMDDPNSVSHACRPLAETIMVPVATAERYGMYDPAADNAALVQEGMIEIPRWRHAVFNFPHPLLKQGLVIIDTPGLNAIGTEHELTLSTIPSAHAVLFVLGADTGVTKSDRAMFVDHIASAGIARGNCVVALNKIDTMWDDLRQAGEYDADIAAQVKKSAQLLGIAQERIFPVSAQKGLIARVQNNLPLLERSRLMALEKAIAQELPQAHQQVMQLALKSDVFDLLQRLELDLDGRQDDLRERREELSSLEGKTRESLNLSADEAVTARESFERVSERLAKLEIIIKRQGNGLLNTLNPKLWHLQVGAAQQKMAGSIFSKGVVDSMKYFLGDSHENLTSARTQSDELHGLVGAIYERFSSEHGFRQPVPAPLSLDHHFAQLDWLNEKLDQRFSSVLRVLASAKSAGTRKYFDALAGSVLELYDHAHRDAQQWLQDILRPLESEVQSRRDRLTQREEQMHLVAQSGQSAAEQMQLLEQDARSLVTQNEKLAELRDRLKKILPEDAVWWAQSEAA